MSDPPPTRGEPIPPLSIEVTRQAARIVVATIKAATDWKAAAVVAAGINAYVYSLPQSERHRVLEPLVSALADHFGLWLFALTGWGLLGLVLLVGIPWFNESKKRYQSQGDELQKYRAEQDPGRLSSRQPEQLEQHAADINQRASSARAKAAEPQQRPEVKKK